MKRVPLYLTLLLACLGMYGLYGIYSDFLHNTWKGEFGRKFVGSGVKLRVIREDCHFFYCSYLVEINEVDLEKCIRKDRLLEVTASPKVWDIQRVKDRIKSRGVVDFDVDAPTVRLFAPAPIGPKNSVAYDTASHHAVVSMDGSMN